MLLINKRTNIKNKGNPLLKKKKEAKEEIKVNDKKLDLNNVPETTGTNTIQPVPQVVEKVETLITNAIEPTTEPVETADIPAPPIAPVTDPSIPAPPVLSTDINQAQQNNTNNQ